MPSRPEAPADGRRTSSLGTRPFRFGSEVEADPDPPLQPGDRIGERHRVVRLLGEGGMGRVYEAEHVVLERRVAIKLLRADAQASADSLARFQQEALAASRIGAPQIVEVVDFASHVGPGGRAQTYMIMELLVGESLEDWMDRPGQLDEGLALLAELCDGLAAAHRAGVIHRDIKPANVFARRPPAGEATPVRVKILDFGIAKVSAGGDSGLQTQGFQTQKGSLLGTPYYLAPERVMGETLTAAADIYSVGVILYEMLTGDVPFVAESFMGVLARHVQTPPLDPRQAAPKRAIPDPVAGLCMRLLAKRPADRPDATEVAMELRALCVTLAPTLGAVPTGPREGSSSSGGDTQVFAASGSPTTAPMLVATPSRSTAIGHGGAVDPTSRAAAPAPLRWRTRAPTAVAAVLLPRNRSRAWLPVAIGCGVAVVVAIGMTQLSAPPDSRPERDDSPRTESAVDPVPVSAGPSAVVLPQAPAEPRSEARAAEPELSPPELASSVTSTPVAAKKTKAKKSVASTPTEPPVEPKPVEPKPVEPKPIQDDVPTIKDDIYD